MVFPLESPVPCDALLTAGTDMNSNIVTLALLLLGLAASFEIWWTSCSRWPKKRWHMLRSAATALLAGIWFHPFDGDAPTQILWVALIKTGFDGFVVAALVTYTFWLSVAAVLVHWIIEVVAFGTD